MQEENIKNLTIDFQESMLKVKIDQSSTLEELYNFLKDCLKLSQQFEELQFYSTKFNKYYSGKDTRLDQDENELKVSIQHKVNLNREIKIHMNIIPVRVFNHFRVKFSENSTYDDLTQIILKYTGYGEDVIQVDLYLHDYPMPHNKTLKELQLQDGAQITAKLRYTGG